MKVYVSKTHLYKIYYGIKNRCYNTKDPNYKKYGANGLPMKNKPTTKDCIKFVCDGLDTINDTMINKNKELAEKNKIEKERLQWEQETKDRVNIPLKKYEAMKEQIDHLTRKNYHYEEIFERLRINEIIDKIDPATIVLSTMKDPIRLTTRVNIQFECKSLIEQNPDGWEDMTPFERFLKRN